MTYQSYCYPTKDELDNLKLENVTINRHLRRRFSQFLNRKRIKRLLHENYVFFMTGLIGLTDDDILIDTADITIAKKSLSKELLSKYAPKPIKGPYDVVVHVNYLQLFIDLAWMAFKKLGDLVGKGIKFVLKLIGRDPYLSVFIAFGSAVAIGLLFLANKFGKELTRIQKISKYIVCGILGCMIAYLLVFLIGIEAAREWYASFISLFIYFWKEIVRAILGKRKIPEMAKDLTKQATLENVKPESASIPSGFKKLIGYSTLVIVLGKYLLHKFKADLVGRGPYEDVLIDLIEFEVTDYFPDFIKRRLE